MSPMSADKEQVQQRVYQAQVTESYMLDDDPEVVDQSKVRLAVLEHVLKARVDKDGQQHTKALTKRALTRLVYPSAPGASGDFGELDEYDIDAWMKLEGAVWSAVNPYQGPIQELVGEATSRSAQGSYVLVRGEVEKDDGREQAVYITRVESLILADFAKPLKDKAATAATRLAKQLAIVAVRQPALAARLGKEVSTTLKGASQQAQSIYMLAAPNAEDEAA